MHVQQAILELGHDLRLVGIIRHGKTPNESPIGPLYSVILLPLFVQMIAARYMDGT